MKTLLPLPSLRTALAASLLLFVLPLSATAAGAADQTPVHAAAGTLVPVTAKTDATWLAQARAAYPLDRCLVCGDKLETGKDATTPEYVFQQAGKPDRLVRFCDGHDCVADFLKDADKYLKIIDEAAAKAAATRK